MSSSKSYVSIKEKHDRVIVLVDMDCFYCQVEELLDLENLKGKPIAVVQYVENAGIIAVNYAARALGITRHMREKEAKAACADLICIKVPSKFNKADISKYRDAGKRVANVFEHFTTLLERASVDEAYMDITENVAERVQQMRDKKFTLQAEHLHNTYFVGYDNIGKFIHEVSLAVDNNDTIEQDSEQKSLDSSKLRLLIGASIVSDIRKAVKDETGYECSAGIAHNKILSKLVCGMNKPNKQTVLPIESTQKLFESLEISKIKSMGGKIGSEICEKLNVKCMAELLPFGEAELHQQCGPRIGNFLYQIARGIDLEKVERKVMSKSIAVSKNFRGKNQIINVNTLKYWLRELSKELKERLDKDNEDTNRLARQMIVQFTQIVNKKDVASSRTVPLNGKAVNAFSSDEIGDEAFKTVERNTAQLLKAEGTFILNNIVKHLGISAGKLEESAAPGKSVQDLLKNHTKNSSAVPKSSADDVDFSKFEYKPTLSKSESSFKATDEKMSVEKSKSDTVIYKSPICEPSTSFKSATEADSPDLSFKSEIKFSINNSIKGEKTLRHWMLQLFLELDKKVNKAPKKPTKIKINWKQLQIDGIKSFNDEVPLNIFPNGINVDFFVNLIKDSSVVFENNAISFLEIEAAGFSAESDVNWMLSVDGSKTVVEDEKSFTKIKDENIMTEIDHPENFTPVDDFESDNFGPENLLDVEMTVLDDEEEILKLERSFLGITSKTVKCEDIPSSSDTSNNKLEANNEPGPSYKNSYVELQQPANVSAMVDVFNPLEECVDCGKMIRKFDMITHIDGHIAMKISLAQREEYRAEQKSRLLQKVNAKSAKKSHKPKTSSTKSNSIEKFAKKEPVNDTSWENSVLCEKCNQLIEYENFEMHQDYHYAQKLRMEQMTIKTNSNSGIKRKQQPNVSHTSKESKKAKSLKDYFKD